MTIRWLFAAIHLLALAIGVAAVWTRARGFRALSGDIKQLARVFAADGFWGLSALLWLGTGLPRAFGGLEKGADYYLGNPLFHAKLTLFGLIVLLELWPMITLIRWRTRLRRGEPIDTSKARTFARISEVQAGLVVAIVFLATALARGLGG
jgi:putative membrane protein